MCVCQYNDNFFKRAFLSELQLFRSHVFAKLDTDGIKDYTNKTYEEYNNVISSIIYICLPKLELKNFIIDYKNRYSISKEQFIEFIEKAVLEGVYEQ